MLQLVDTAIGFSVVMLMLSLLITAAVQAISALLDLRGKNLAKHVEMLLDQICPDLRKTLAKLASDAGAAAPSAEEGAKKASNLIADAVVNHPALAQGAKGVTWVTRRAKAIRSDELVAVLRDLASADSAGKLDEVAKKALETFVEPHDRSGEMSQLLVQVHTALNNQHPQVEQKLATLIHGAGARVSHLEQGVEQWFDTVMSRSSDVFQRSTRGITVGAAVLLALLVQIDSGRILHQLYTNADIRNSFVKMADDVTKRADEILQSGVRGTTAANDLKQQEQDAQKRAETAQQEAKAKGDSDAEKKAGEQAGDHQKNGALFAAVPQSMTTCDMADTWLAGQKRADGTPAPEDLRKKLRATCTEVTERELKLDATTMQTLTDKLKDSQLEIVGWDRSKPWYGYGERLHLLGIFASIVLLSFGAPFWFNALRQLTNLKPTVASNIAQEEAAERAPSTSGAPKSQAKATGTS